jgi:hypothetical protein
MSNHILLYKNRYINLEKEVDVYRCLNRKGKFYSIKQRGVVVGHTDNIVLSDCKFIVNASGKKKAIETKQRNVHAYIRGRIIHTEQITTSATITYNPFDNNGFVSEGLPIVEAKGVVINHSGVKKIE